MKKVAAFDFDGTLFPGDVLFPFLVYCSNFGWLKSLPEFFLYPIYRDRERLKLSLIRSTLKGRSYREIMEKGREFYEKFVEGKLRLLDQLERKRKEGALLILISANIEPVLINVKRDYGFDALICSELAVDVEGRITGNLAVPNCWGQEKAHRLEEYMKGEPFTLEAWGDSEGDRQMLERAEIPHWVK